MTPRELQNWLEERPEETRHREAFWIGLRCMLRMLPRYFSQMPEIKRGEKQQFLTSGLGLAMMVEWSFSGVDSVVQGDGEIHLQNINLDFLLSLAARAKSRLEILPGSAIADMVNALDPYQDALQSASRENDFEEQNWSRSLNALTECAVKQVRKGNELYGEDIIGPMFTESIDADVERVLVGTNMANIPLWSPRSLEISDQAWPKSGGPWDFWIDWYQRALDGTPQPMDLLEKIAFQPDAFWEGTDGEVNARIAEIVAEWEAGLEAERRQLLAEVKALREEVRSHRAGVASPSVRSSNLPEDMEPLDVIDADLAKMDVELHAAETELEQGQPSKTRLKAIAAALGRMSKATLVYIAKKADKAVDTIVEEGTKRAVQAFTIAVGAGIIERIFNLSEAIMKFADKVPWL